MCSEIGCGSANRRHGTWEELERMEDRGCRVGKEVKEKGDEKDRVR